MNAEEPGQDLIRLSVGTEDVTDIIADLSRAFDAIARVMDENECGNGNVPDTVQTTPDGTGDIKSDVEVKEAVSIVTETL